jgi:hypothetical protein
VICGSTDDGCYCVECGTSIFVPWEGVGFVECGRAQFTQAQGKPCIGWANVEEKANYVPALASADYNDETCASLSV